MQHEKINMADQGLEPAWNVPRLLIWPKHVAQRQQQPQNIVQNQPGNIVEQCTEPEINLSQNFETDESEVREDIQDSEETFAEGLLSMERNQINPTAPNQTISTALIEEVRKHSCIWNISLSSHKVNQRKWKLGEGLQQC